MIVDFSKEGLKAENVSDLERDKKKYVIKNMNTLLYWFLLIVAIIGNFIVSVVLVPFLLILTGPFLFFSLFFIGLSFGYLFSFVLHSLEELQPKQHIIAKIFIPFIALINVVIMASLTNQLILLLDLSTPFHNPLFVGIAYFIGYTLPEAIKYRKR